MLVLYSCRFTNKIWGLKKIHVGKKISMSTAQFKIDFRKCDAVKFITLIKCSEMMHTTRAKWGARFKMIHDSIRKQTMTRVCIFGYDRFTQLNQITCTAPSLFIQYDPSKCDNDSLSI